MVFLNSTLYFVCLMILFSCKPRGKNNLLNSSQSVTDLSSLLHHHQKCVALKRGDFVECILDKLDPSLAYSYTLLHSSDSTQDASPLEPRVVFFKPQGDLLFAFTGDSKGVEVLSFPLGGPSRAYFLTDDLKNLDQVSGCSDSSCHGKDLRPVWATYGTVGGGHWLKSYNRDPLRRNVFEPNFKGFLAAASGKTRYRKLKKPLDFPLFPYLAEESEAFFRPNTHLSFVMAKVMARHFFAKLAVDGTTDVYKEVLLKIFGCTVSGKYPKVDEMLRVKNLVPSQSDIGWHSGSGTLRAIGYTGHLADADVRVLGRVLMLVLKKLRAARALRDSLGLGTHSFEDYFNEDMVNSRSYWSEEKLKSVFTLYRGYVEDFDAVYFYPGFDTKRCLAIASAN